MLKDGFFTRFFIRWTIRGLRAIAPLSIVYCGGRLLGLRIPINIAVRTAVDVYAASEALFCLLIYLPRRVWLSRAAPELLPEQLQSRDQRRTLFLRTWDCTPDPRGYVSLWFKGVPIEQLQREDIKDWLSWRMFNKTSRSVEDEDELDEYLELTENVLKHSFPDGSSKFESMAVTFEPVRMMHRPLLWYLIVIGAVDQQLTFYMWHYGYRFFGQPLAQQITTIPWRPLLLFYKNSSPTKRISYWHLEHTSTDHLPILFIHGIGIGLQFYLDFLKGLKQLNKEHGIGVISLEILQISSRMTQPILQGQEMAAEILKILNHHNWSQCMVISHSYGSVITTHMLHDTLTSNRIGPLLFIDPVAFSFHSPQVPWNFLRREPRSASEIQLQYFASMDPDVAYTLTRRFIWPDNSLWREDIEARATSEFRHKCTVAVSGRDIIVDTNTLGSYLTRERSESVKWYEQEDRFDDSWKDAKWTGQNDLEVVYFPTRNHAEIFESKEDQALLLDIAEKYASDGSSVSS